MSIIEFKNVSYSYNYSTESEVKAVKDISLSIKKGEFVALVGHNGSGKSTIAKLCNGLFLPQSGSISVNGIATTDSSKIFDIRKTVGVVFQNPDNQMVASIIEDDIAFGPENLGLSPAEIRERVDWALESVGMLAYKNKTPFRLSGGQKQRVAIAGVLALKPEVMVLDESTAMLDPIGRAEVMEVVHKLNKTENMTVVMITHFMEETTLADRIIVMDKGEIAFTGGKEIFKREEDLSSIGLDVPIACRVANALRKKGLELNDDIVDIKELVAKLCQ